MASVNEQIVRVFLEQLGFMVRQPRKYQIISRPKTAVEEIDLVALRPTTPASQLWPNTPIWGATELLNVRCAVFAVRGWHSERFSPAILARSPDVYRFASPEASRAAEAEFPGETPAHVLCIADLPADAALRNETVSFLQKNGVDGILLFRPMLRALIDRIDVKKSYEREDVLQLLRILKCYDFLKDAQMDLFGKRRYVRPPRPAAPPDTKDLFP